MYWWQSTSNTFEYINFWFNGSIAHCFLQSQRCRCFCTALCFSLLTTRKAPANTDHRSDTDVLWWTFSLCTGQHSFLRSFTIHFDQDNLKVFWHNSEGKKGCRPIFQSRFAVVKKCLRTKVLAK